MNSIEFQGGGERLPVLLSIHAEQDVGGQDQDQMELMTEGLMEITRNGSLALTYEESTLTGMEGTTTVFEVDGPRVILRRVGSVSKRAGSIPPSMRRPTGNCPSTCRPAISATP